MPLRSLDLPTTLDTSTADMVADFYAPALAASIRYDRGVGFFSSGWLRIAAQGLVPFLPQMAGELASSPAPFWMRTIGTHWRRASRPRWTRRCAGR